VRRKPLIKRLNFNGNKMTIQLSTYDPNWQARWYAVLEQWAQHGAAPDTRKTEQRRNILLNKLQSVFHTRFRTTGEYAEWIETTLCQFAQSEGLPDTRIPNISRESPVEATTRLYFLAIDRIKIEAKAEGNLLKLEQPAQGAAFSLDLAEGSTRIISTVQLKYHMPVFKGTKEIRREEKEVSHGYVFEELRRSANICFFQGSQDEGPSPINAIDRLATQFYQTHFGSEAIAFGDRVYAPNNVGFYVYAPPLVTGIELYTRIDMSWNDNASRYFNPVWNHLNEVPYILRKLAAVDGLAKDPDAPLPPAAQRATPKFPGQTRE
jgi:hypothetical protein